MKRLILSLFGSVFIAAAVGPVSALAAPAQTDVTGVITASSVAVAGATVTTTCNGNVLMDTTDAHGSYLTVYPKALCDFGDTVKVVAQKGGHSGVSSGTVQGITTKLNISIVNVSIPEYGLLGALTAGTAGLGLIAFTRRRREQQSQL